MTTNLFLNRTRWLHSAFCTLILLFSLGVGNAWSTDPVATAVATSGNSYVVAAWDGSTYYALPNGTTGGQWTATTVTVNSSGKVTSNNPPLWTLTVNPSNANQFYLTYESNETTYYLYKNGNNTTNKNIAGKSNGDKNYWQFSLKNDNSAYNVIAQGRGSNHTRLNQYNSGSNHTWQVHETATNVYNIILLEVAPAGPTITPSVTELDWGTVNKGESLSTKTFTITGSNLTSAALVYSASGGYSVSPSGKAGAAGTLASQTLTVTPPSTATPGTYNSTVTVSGGGLSSAVSVTVKLTVQETDEFIDEIQSTSGYTSVSPHIEGGSYTTPKLSDKTPTTSGTCAQQHWHFVGWVPEDYKASPKGHITNGGTSGTADGTTYYAVWSKGVAGDSFDNTAGGEFYIYATINDVNYYATSISSSKLQKTTDIASATKFTFTKISNGVYSIYDGSAYLYNTSSSGTNLSTQASSFSWTISTGSYGSWRVVGDTRALIYRKSTYNYFGAYTTGSVNGTEYFDIEIGGATIYSDSIAICCTPLASINGSITWSEGTSATLTWNSMSNVDATTPYTVTYRTGSAAYGDTNVGSITTNGAGKKTCTITSLTAGTSYDFKIAVTAASNYCDKDSVITSTAPKITASATLTGSDYAYGSGPGTVKNFSVSGVGLTGDITVTAPTNFEVCKTSDGTYTSSVTYSPTSGTLSSTTVYIRLAAGKAVGSYGASAVTISGGSAANNTSVTIAGAVTAACSVPSIGDPTLTSITSGTITVSCPTISGGTNCDVDDYGFVWKSGSAPTISDNKTQKGTNNQSSAYSDGLSISFSTGTTYYIKAYAHNSAGNNVSTNALQVTPQSITFNSNGGSDVATKYANNGSTTSAPSAPTKTGYTFDSWRTTSGLTTAMNFSGTITKDTTLYAKWTAKSYDVTLKTNGGSGADKVVSATYDADMPLTLKDSEDALTGHSKQGHTLLGYWDDASAGNQYYSYNAGTSALSSYRTWNKDAATNLYAHWQANVYPVTLDANGGVDGATTSVNATYGSAMPTIASANLPTREGYRFDGFYTGKTDGTKYYNADGTSAKNMTMYSENNKLYAHWKALTYFSVDGTVDGSLTIDDGATMPSADVPTACGDCWAFLGWSTDSEESSAADYSSGATHEFGEPTTLYAVYGQIKYEMITSTDGLVANDNYVIASSSEWALSNVLHSTYTVAAGYGGDAASADISSLTRVNADGISLYNPTSDIIWELKNYSSSSGQLFNDVADLYVNLDAEPMLDADPETLSFTLSDDGETWIIKSSTPMYLHGYTDPAGNGFESLNTSYWEEGMYSAYILHQTSSTVTTSPSCETYTIAWKKDGSAYTTGGPTTSTNTCAGIEDLPTDPDDDELDCATKFMGWTETPLVGTGHDEPDDLFYTVGDAPKIDENKTFHAVFASVDTENTMEVTDNLTYSAIGLGYAGTGETYTGFENVSSSSSAKYAGQAIRFRSSYSGDGTHNYIQIKSKGSNTGIVTTSSGGLAKKVTITWNSTQSAAKAINVYGKNTAYSAASDLFNSSTYGTLLGTITYGTNTELTISGDYAFIGLCSSDGAFYMDNIAIKWESPAYKDYMTSCCDELVTISDPTITGSGATITFDQSSPVATCDGDVDVEATVTVTPGYSVTALSFSGGDVVIDPVISTPLTTTTNYTLSFDQHTTATLTTTATVVALVDKYYDYMHDNAQKYSKEGNYGTVPTPTDKAVTKVDNDCKSNHYKFVGWVPEDDMNMETGVPTTMDNMVEGGATGKYATGTKYYAIWAEEE